MGLQKGFKKGVTDFKNQIFSISNNIIQFGNTPARLSAFSPLHLPIYEINLSLY